MKIALLSLAMALMMPLYAQKNAAIETVKEQLCKKWNYSKCRILGIEYISREVEQKDMIAFGKDMTYTTVENGLEKQGTWTYVPEKNKIQLHDDEKQLVKELMVEKLTDSEFVYTVTTSWQYEVSMFMTTEVVN